MGALDTAEAFIGGEARGMSERGVFAVDRGIWDHSSFAQERFTEREAWMWLIGCCAWEAKRVRVGSAVIDLDRGQCAFSLRFMATRWHWSEPKVRRFLNRLKTDAMVVVDTTQKVTRITVCNYGKYAFGRRSNVIEIDAQTDAAPTQHRRKEEELKETKKEEKKDSCAVARATRPKVSEAFEEFWKAYPRRLGANPKAPAAKVFNAAVKQGAEPAAIVEGARRCAAADYDKIGTPYIPQALKWLRDRRWEDYVAGPPGDPGMSEDERKKLFEELRNGGSRQAGTDLRATGASPCPGEGDGRKGQTTAADNQTGNTGMVGMGSVFHPPPGLRAGGDEAGSDGIESGNDSAVAMARRV